MLRSHGHANANADNFCNFYFYILFFWIFYFYFFLSFFLFLCFFSFFQLEVAGRPSPGSEWGPNGPTPLRVVWPVRASSSRIGKVERLNKELGFCFLEKQCIALLNRLLKNVTKDTNQSNQQRIIWRISHKRTKPTYAPSITRVVKDYICGPTAPK